MSKKELGTLVEEQKKLNRIYLIRNEKVMLDKDLGELYGVETRALKQAVKRNTPAMGQATLTLHQNLFQSFNSNRCRCFNGSDT